MNNARVTKTCSPRNWKFLLTTDGWQRHGKNRHNCAVEKHATDILRQWKAGYRRPDLSPWVSGLMFPWWPSADGTKPGGTDHAGVQERKRRGFCVAGCHQWWIGKVLEWNCSLTNMINIYEKHINIFRYFYLNLIQNEGISDHINVPNKEMGFFIFFINRYVFQV